MASWHAVAQPHSINPNDSALTAKCRLTHLPNLFISSHNAIEPLVESVAAAQKTSLIDLKHLDRPLCKRYPIILCRRIANACAEHRQVSSAHWTTVIASACAAAIPFHRWHRPYHCQDRPSCCRLLCSASMLPPYITRDKGGTSRSRYFTLPAPIALPMLSSHPLCCFGREHTAHNDV